MQTKKKKEATIEVGKKKDQTVEHFGYKTSFSRMRNPSSANTR
jgi:hypothetical protein